jgi:hypothetical protein
MKSENSGVLPLDLETMLQKAKPCDLGNRELITFSRLSAFRNCARVDYYRNNLNIVPNQEDDTALRFGTLMHEAWEAYFSGVPLYSILISIGKKLTDGNSTIDPDKFNLENIVADKKKMYHLACSIMKAYAEKYPIEESPYIPVALEYQFLGEIYNPFSKTRCKNRHFAVGGKVDGIIWEKATGFYYILEHKTASSIDQGYLDKLWSDSQICLYSIWIEQILGIKIAGVLYDIAVKPLLRQREGETLDEFELRKEAAIAEGKNPNRLRMKVAETDEEYAERLLEKMHEPMSLHREIIPMETFQRETLTVEMWHWIAAMHKARKTGLYLRNTGQCYAFYGKPCPYLQVCRSGDAEHIIANYYHEKGSHAELSLGNEIENDLDVLEAF